MIDDLRTIVEKVEQKAHVPPDNPDVIALRRIVENKISELETQQDFNPAPTSNAAKDPLEITRRKKQNLGWALPVSTTECPFPVPERCLSL